MNFPLAQEEGKERKGEELEKYDARNTHTQPASQPAETDAAIHIKLREFNYNKCACLKYIDSAQSTIPNSFPQHKMPGTSF